MQGRFKMEYRLFTIVRYNYRDYNSRNVLQPRGVFTTNQRYISRNYSLNIMII